MTTAAKLKRTTFVTSREMDFFNEKELITQTGHSRDEWPLVLLKELIDNALDACEEAEVAPAISVTATSTGISVKDNGPGIPESTIRGAMDFSVRASNREAYVAPDRGAQGNALMTILAMPYVIAPDDGKLTITSHGTAHEITCGADPVTQRPMITHNPRQVSKTPGTKVAIEWPETLNNSGSVLWPFDEDGDPVDDGPWSIRSRAHDLLRGFALFNPHLTLTIQWFEQTLHFRATDPAWQKWRPNKPTSPHWYEQKHLERLIGAYIAWDREHDQDRTVGSLLAEFDGLTSTQKRKTVLAETGMSRTRLSELVNGDGFLSGQVWTLLEAMRKHTKVVKAKRLGWIGRDHIQQRFVELGCDPDQFQYARVAREDDGIPFVLESAFGWLGDDAPDRRQIFSGANWSAAIKNPFRAFGSTGQGLEAQLTHLRAGADEPIAFVLHAAHPRVEYTDRGKSALVVAH